MASVADSALPVDPSPDATPPTQKRDRDAGEDAREDAAGSPPAKKLDAPAEDDEYDGVAARVQEAFEKAVSFKVNEVAPKEDHADALKVFEAMWKADTARCRTGSPKDDPSADHLHRFELRDIQNTVAAYAKNESAAFAVHVFVSVETLNEASEYLGAAMEYVESSGLRSSVTAMQVTDLEYVQLLAALGDIEEIEDYLGSLSRAVYYGDKTVEDVPATLAQKRYILVIR